MTTQTRYGNDSHYKAKRGDYMTTPKIYAPILHYFNRDRFDIDVSCSNRNIPAKHYYTKNGIFHNSTDNGLIQPWHGLCFCNPQWDIAMQFVKKGDAEIMINPDTEIVYVLSSDKMYIGYVQDYFVKNPNAVFWFLPGKQGFIIPGKEHEPVIPSVGVMMAILSKRAAEIEYGLNFYNTYNTTIFKGEKPRVQHEQTNLFD